MLEPLGMWLRLPRPQLGIALGRLILVHQRQDKIVDRSVLLRLDLLRLAVPLAVSLA